MPASEKEVWDYFSSDGDDNQQVNFLAFSSFSFDKFEWMDKFIELHDRPPTENEINNWIAQLPDSRLGEMREWAENFFEAAARALLDDEHKAEVQDAINNAVVTNVRDSNEAIRSAFKESNDSLLQRVKSATSFGGTWIPNMFVGIMSSFVFAILILLASLIFTKDPSPTSLLKNLTNTQVKTVP